MIKWLTCLFKKKPPKRTLNEHMISFWEDGGIDGQREREKERKRMKLICLNGPPSSGKDTAADLLCELLPGRVYSLKLAAPIQAALCSAFSISREELMERKEDKVLPEREATWRDMMIHFSEDYLKYYLGHDIFGKLFVKHIQTAIELYGNINYVVVSDCGFVEELKAVQSSGLFEEPFLIYHVTRGGCDFSIDSRSYISDPDWLIIELMNNGSIDDLKETLKAEIKTWPKVWA